MTDKFDDDKLDMDDAGVYAIPGKYRTKLKNLMDYCKSLNKDVDDLTQEEIKQFIVKEKQELNKEDSFHEGLKFVFENYSKTLERLKDR